MLITVEPPGLSPGGRLCLVPSARLELAQLSPLPPQDSVSTNFTTSAVFKCPDGMRNLAVLAFRAVLEFTLKLRRPL